MRRSKFWIISIIVLPFFLLAVAPVTVLAQTDAAVSNPICWQKDACKAERERQGMGNPDQGWVQEQPCLGDWGKCLAGGVTETQISFAGKKQFNNIGEFILVIYNYSLIAISILAVIVVVVAGAQWTASAGNSEVIAQAKKRILGAVIGLLIAFMSYTILNSINPATVNLRLPQIWLLRDVPLPTKWCQDVRLGTGTASFTDVFKVNADYISLAKDNYGLELSDSAEIPQKDTICGIQYASPAGGSCLGNSCQNLKLVNPQDPKVKDLICGKDVPCTCSEKGLYKGQPANICDPSNFGGKITLKDPEKTINYAYIWAVYQDGHIGDKFGATMLADFDNKDEDTTYSMTITPGAIEKVKFCDPTSTSTVVGFVLVIQVEDSALGPTYDDDWLLGKTSCGSGGQPFAGSNYAGDLDPAGVICDGSVWNPPEEDRKKMEVKTALLRKMQQAGALWTKDEINAGVTCDLEISPQTYRNLSDSDIKDGVYFYP